MTLALTEKKERYLTCIMFYELKSCFLLFEAFKSGRKQDLGSLLGYSCSDDFDERCIDVSKLAYHIRTEILICDSQNSYDDFSVPNALQIFVSMLF